jgi:hypothetical protein
MLEERLLSAIGLMRGPWNKTEWFVVWKVLCWGQWSIAYCNLSWCTSTNVYLSKFHYVAPHPQSTNSTCRWWLKKKKKNKKTKRKIEIFHKSLQFNECGLLRIQWRIIKPIFNPLLMSDRLLEVVEIITWWSLVQRFRV